MSIKIIIQLIEVLIAFLKHSPEHFKHFLKALKDLPPGPLIILVHIIEVLCFTLIAIIYIIPESVRKSG